MKKLFSLLAAATALLIIVAGLGIFWLSNMEISKAKTDASAAEAKSVAIGLAAEIDFINKTLDKMTLDPDVINAIAIGNSGLLKAASAKLELHIPNILKIRLLLPDTNEIDEQAKPHMGFADLELVRETFKQNQFPGIHGEKGGDRHLAIARTVKVKGQIIGVLLASFDENIIQHNLQLSNLKSGYLELKQGTLVLGMLGTKNNDEDSNSASIPVANTDWAIHYKADPKFDFGNASLVTSIILIPVIIALLGIFISQQWLSNLLRQDLESLMKAFKDIMTNNSHSNYPVELTEMTAAVSNLMQFKRVMEFSERDKNDLQERDEDISILVSDEDFSLDDLFDETNDFKL